MIGTINALLVVQMFHFLVAYLLLKYLFLRPGLRVVEELDSKEQALQRDVILAQEEVARQDALAKDQWERHCRVLSSRMPVHHVALAKGVDRTISDFETLPVVEEQQLAHRVKESIINQVLREHA